MFSHVLYITYTTHDFFIRASLRELIDHRGSCARLSFPPLLVGYLPNGYTRVCSPSYCLRMCDELTSWSRTARIYGGHAQPQERFLAYAPHAFRLPNSDSHSQCHLQTTSANEQQHHKTIKAYVHVQVYEILKRVNQYQLTPKASVTRRQQDSVVGMNMTKKKNAKTCANITIPYHYPLLRCKEQGQ